MDKALGLEANSATAQALLSEIRMFGDWDFAGARANLDLALDLNPQSLFVRHNIAWFYLCSGEFDRAIVEAEQALLLEPSSMVFLLVLGRALTFRGDFSQAIACYSNVLESAPDDVWARMMRAITFIFAGTPQPAIEDLLRVPRNRPEIPLLARAYADAGEHDRSVRVLDDLNVLATTQYVPNWDFAIAFAALDRRNEAFERLRMAMEAREPLMLLLPGLAKLFGSVRDDRRFQRMLGELLNLKDNGV